MSFTPGDIVVLKKRVFDGATLVNPPGEYTYSKQPSPYEIEISSGESSIIINLIYDVQAIYSAIDHSLLYDGSKES